MAEGLFIFSLTLLFWSKQLCVHHCENASTEAIVLARSHLRCVSNPLQLDTTDSSSKDSFPPTMNKILDDI